MGFVYTYITACVSDHESGIWPHLSKLLVDHSYLVCLGHWVLVKFSNKLWALNNNFFVVVIKQAQNSITAKVV